MAVIEIQAAYKWRNVEKHVQKMIIENTYCSKCGVTTIDDYSIQTHDLGVLLTGVCKKCQKPVARVVENV